MKRIWTKLVTLALFGGAATVVAAQAPERTVIGGLTIGVGASSAPLGRAVDDGLDEAEALALESMLDPQPLRSSPKVSRAMAKGRKIITVSSEGWGGHTTARPHMDRSRH